MPAGPSRFRRIWSELRRRRVVRVVAAYLVVAWMVIEGAETVFPYLGLPDWSVTLVIALCALGLPLTAVLAWALELTPEGIRRTPPATRPEGLVAGSAWIPDEDRPDDEPARGWGPALGFAGLLVALALLGGWFAVARPDDEAEAVMAHIAVFPFAVRGSPELEYLGEGMVDLLGRNLDGAAEYRSVDPTTMVRLASSSREATLDPGAAAELARQVHASLFVLGSITEVAGRLRIQAGLYAAETGTRSTAEVEGEAHQVFQLVDRLSQELLAELGEGEAAARLIRTAAHTTESVEAVKAYLEAEAALRSARYAAAIEGFQRAIAEDSAFALARYRLAVAAWWSEPPHLALAEQAIAGVRPYADRLGERDRRLLVAYEAFWAGDPSTAEDHYRRILQSYPNEIEAQFQLAEVLHHYNAPRGRPAVEAMAPFQAVLAADPKFVCPI